MLDNVDGFESTHRIFDVVLLIIASVDTLLQLYNSFLIMLVAKKILNEYRYFLLMSTVSQRIFADGDANSTLA